MYDENAAMDGGTICGGDVKNGGQTCDGSMQRNVNPDRIFPIYYIYITCSYVYYYTTGRSGYPLLPVVGFSQHPKVQGKSQGLIVRRRSAHSH